MHGRRSRSPQRIDEFKIREHALDLVRVMTGKESVAHVDLIADPAVAVRHAEGVRGLALSDVLCTAAPLSLRA
jgi:hypothetical protein